MRFILLCLSCFCLSGAVSAPAAEGPQDAQLAEQFKAVRAIQQKYCLDCHSAAVQEGELDFQRFASVDKVRDDVKPWQAMIVQLETGEMPPRDEPQPSAAERKLLLDWTRMLLRSEALARAGDPGRVPLRRLSNTEYNYTIRDLTGVDLQPTRDFPADGAAGEGFTNAAEALSMSPAMMAKYLNASKEVAAHAVLLPDGFRFSPKATTRDWTDESLARLREFYHQFTEDGSLPLKQYVSALMEHRAELQAGNVTLEEIAANQKLSPKYLNILWEAFHSEATSYPLDQIRARWDKATENDVDQIVEEVNAWRDPLWNFVKIGSYRDGATTRQVAKEPSMPIPDGMSHAQFLAGLAEFRGLFPPNICYPHVIPVDELVCLKTFHREDEPLKRLFLDEQQAREIDRLWAEHRFITKFPVVENEYLPLFIGFVTQDQPQSLVDYFEGQRPVFRARAEQFERDYQAAAPAQLAQLLEFASRAWRRPLTAEEQQDLRALYQTLRDEGVPHEEAFRSLLGRVLISPAFLLHLEQPTQGEQPGPIDDWELASRLSYFLWATLPDEQLRQLAAAGRLHEPEILAAQTRRMLADDRIRALAIEFGTQWIHVRGFDQFQDKNENLFPTFDQSLRGAMYEESILFFQDLFQLDRSVRQILDADYTFLNQQLAEHYGIDGVAGGQWQRVEGVKQHGRGGILGLASVQAKQAGASRTSPTLRGTWVVEALLGEKMPLPPPNIPQLPETETGNDGLTMRQVVEQHVNVEACAVCHRRIDPLGFALERYDPIGRLRDQDLGGLPLDSAVTLRDGTRFEGLDGLRQYLLTQKKETFARKFYQRLIGYALGRSVTLSDQLLIDQMMQQTDEGNGPLSAAVLAIVQSPQFRMIRGADHPSDP